MYRPFLGFVATSVFTYGIEVSYKRFRENNDLPNLVCNRSEWQLEQAVCHCSRIFGQKGPPAILKATACDGDRDLPYL